MSVLQHVYSYQLHHTVYEYIHIFLTAKQTALQMTQHVGARSGDLTCAGSGHSHRDDELTVKMYICNR